MIECIHGKNIKTKITVNVNIFIVVLMNCVSPWVGWLVGFFYFYSEQNMQVRCKEYKT